MCANRRPKSGPPSAPPLIPPWSAASQRFGRTSCKARLQVPVSTQHPSEHVRAVDQASSQRHVKACTLGRVILVSISPRLKSLLRRLKKREKINKFTSFL